ncbi:MAG: GNAT family N-acetyltransferase [Bacteroidetes bacterium]|nr:GNAT family N-acetyltransferase [Bacteroidota bacterium]
MRSLNLNFNPFPEIHTKRLQLRSITADDAGWLLEMRSDPTMMEFIDRPLMREKSEALELITKIATTIQKGEGMLWAITEIGSERMIGSVSYHNIDGTNLMGEIGYMLHTDFQKKGIMQEAVMSVITFGFSKIGFHRIEANINTGNESSRKLLLRNGFKKEALFRENYYYNNKFLNSEIYGLLEHEWSKYK